MVKLCMVVTYDHAHNSVHNFDVYLKMITDGVFDSKKTLNAGFCLGSIYVRSLRLCSVTFVFTELYTLYQFC